MKIWKRFAAALLAAGMVLAMLAACSDGGGGTPLSWETSRTKQYFESKGITGKEYTFKGTAEGIGGMGNVVYCVRGEQFYLGESYDRRVVDIIKDAQGDYYIMYSDEGKWHKWAKGSTEAKDIEDNYAKYLFELPTKENVGSIKADEPYTFNGKSYYVETIKTHENRKFLTRSFLYEGNELKYILFNVGSEAMFTNIDVNSTVDDQLFKAPEHYVSGGGNSGSTGGSTGGSGSGTFEPSSPAASSAS